MSRFLPFIGRQYEDSIFGARVMILGLSHYGDPEDAVILPANSGHATK